MICLCAKHQHSFTKVIQIAKIQKSKGNGSEVIIDTEALLRHALTFFYYWVTFAPLSRGSAACGYAVLHSMLLAGGYELTTSTGKNTFGYGFTYWDRLKQFAFCPQIATPTFNGHKSLKKHQVLFRKTLFGNKPLE